MGSLVSSVVAILFTEDFEDKTLDQAGNARPSEWHRFVNDVFSICMKDQLSELPDFLNHQDSNIQFTVHC